MIDKAEVERRKAAILALTEGMDAEDKESIIAAVQVQLGEYLKAHGAHRPQPPEPPSRHDVEELMQAQVERIHGQAVAALPPEHPNPDGSVVNEQRPVTGSD